MCHAIWSHEDKDWIRELNEYKAKPILLFELKEDAEKRAAQYYGFDTYYEVVINGYAEVRPLTLDPVKK